MTEKFASKYHIDGITQNSALPYFCINKMIQL